MSNTIKTAVIAVTLLLLNACNTADPGRPATPQGKVVARVNNVEITEPEVNSLVNARRMNGQHFTPQQSLEELIGLELLRQEAMGKDIHNDPDVAAEINRQVANIIVANYVNDYFTENPVTDEDIATAYEQDIEAKPDKEYKASHILVKTEDEAREIIKQLDDGADFSELAKQKSIGPSGKSGGSLGNWSSPSNFVPEFALALQGIEVGKYSSEPVKTQFGWHVILVNDVRDANRPPLEQVKQNLQRKIMSQRMNNLVETLRENANVTIISEEEETTASAEERKKEEEAKPAETPVESEKTTETETPTGN